MVQPGPDIASVRVRFGDGTSDRMAPDHGVAVLAHRGAAAASTIEGLGVDGRVAASASIPTPQCDEPACTPATLVPGSTTATPTLPAPGVQPADLAGARLAVTQAFAGAFDGSAVERRARTRDRRRRQAHLRVRRAAERTRRRLGQQGQDCRRGDRLRLPDACSREVPFAARSGRRNFGPLRRERDPHRLRLADDPRLVLPTRPPRRCEVPVGTRARRVRPSGRQNPPACHTSGVPGDRSNSGLQTGNRTQATPRLRLLDVAASRRGAPRLPCGSGTRPAFEGILRSSVAALNDDSSAAAAQRCRQ